MAAATGPVVSWQPDSANVAALDRLDAAGWPRTPPDASDAATAALRAQAWPALDDLRALRWGLGCPAPRLVLVGEAAPKDEEGRPFLSRSGVWLLRSLREAGHDELTIYLVNAFRGRRAMRAPLQALRAALDRHDPAWIALGANAARVLRGAGLEHVRVPHPAAYRRFHYGIGPQGYARVCLERGLPAGPWAIAMPDPPHVDGVLHAPRAAVPLFTGPEAAEPDRDWLDAWHLPSSVAYKATKDVSIPNQNDGRVERARRLYVLGEAPTLRHAATLAGLEAHAYPRLLDQARVEGWDEERRAHESDVRARASSKAAEIEAEALVSSRRTAAASVATALRSVYTRMNLPEDDPKRLVPRPLDVESLARTFALLADRGDVGADAELDRLKTLPLADQIAHAARVARNLGETDPALLALAARADAADRRPTQGARKDDP